MIVGLGNGEPATVVDAIEQGASGLHVVRLHQMLSILGFHEPDAFYVEVIWHKPDVADSDTLTRAESTVVRHKRRMP